MLSVAAVLAAGAGREIATMVELHPHQYIAYNALAGGPPGAAGRYELDYWSNFLPEAVSRLEDHIAQEGRGRPAQPYRVGVCTEPAALEAVAPRDLVWTNEWGSADFVISTTSGGCDGYSDGRVLLTVKRDGVVIGVVKDRRHPADLHGRGVRGRRCET